MKPDKTKMVAPIVITVLLVVYYAIYFGFLISMLGGMWKYVLGVVPVLVTLLLIKVCLERIDEIKKGEEDAARKY